MKIADVCFLLLNFRRVFEWVEFDDINLLFDVFFFSCCGCPWRAISCSFRNDHLKLIGLDLICRHVGKLARLEFECRKGKKKHSWIAVSCPLNQGKRNLSPALPPLNIPIAIEISCMTNESFDPRGWKLQLETPPEDSLAASGRCTAPQPQFHNQ